MKEKEIKWLVCENCCSELDPNELGLFQNLESESISGFCPACGWRVFITSNEFDWESEELKEVSENGPEKYYAYPKEELIVKMPKKVWINRHKRFMEEIN